MITDVEYMALYYQTKKNAAKRGKAFSVTVKQYMNIVKFAAGRCQVTGIPFSCIKINGSSRRPYYPSIDRIDSKKGYTKDNIRVVTVAYNFACNEWGDSPLLEIARRLHCKDGYKKQLELPKTISIYSTKERPELMTIKEFKESLPQDIFEIIKYNSIHIVAARAVKDIGGEIKKVEQVSYISKTGKKSFQATGLYPTKILLKITEEILKREFERRAFLEKKLQSNAIR